MLKNLIFNICLFLTFSSIGQSIIKVPQDYNTIQEALNMASEGSTVLVSPGIYNENIVWPIDVLDINLIGEEGPESTIIDGSNHNEQVLKFPSSQVSMNANILIDGFTIRNGNGGIFISQTGPRLQNLIIENNTSVHGAGIRTLNSESTFINCIIRNNKAISSIWSRGGGLFIEDSNIQIIDCVIENNSVSGQESSHGGGIFIRSSKLGERETNTSIINCKISNNQVEGSKSNGSGIYVSNLNGIEILNSVISGNFSSNIDEGSTLYLSGTDLSLLHCTIFDNMHGVSISNGIVRIGNTILYGNGIHEIETNLNGQAEVNYSLIQGGFEGQGNIAGDPGFESLNSQKPGPNSICINAGNTAIGISSDIEGSPRPLPSGTRPDIGAYEIDQNASIINVKFYDDKNENGFKDNDELYFGVGSVLLNNESVYFNRSADGVFIETENLGEHIISWNMDSSNLWRSSEGQDDLIVFVDSTDFFATFNFGIRPVREIKKLISGVHLPTLLCNRTVTATVVLMNSGTTVESGTLWFNIDERMTEFVPIDSADFAEGNKLAWNFETLAPGSSLQKQLYIELPTFSLETQNDAYAFSSEVSIINDTDFFESYEHLDIIRCAYDPNDKLVYPNREDQLALIDEKLIYTIRFQNVGNYYAEDVLVVDTLDSNLDASTFNLIGTSHPTNLQIDFDNNLVRFAFEDIFLPDSTTNFEASNGFVMFSIQPDSTVAEFSEVHNNSHIYFDFNEAIITNTTTNILVSEFPIIDATQENTPYEFEVFPNPASSKFYFLEAIDAVHVMSARGNRIIDLKNVTEIDVSQFSSGIYFAWIVKGNKQGYIKLIVKH